MISCQGKQGTITSGKFVGILSSSCRVVQDIFYPNKWSDIYFVWESNGNHSSRIIFPVHLNQLIRFKNWTERFIYKSHFFISADSMIWSLSVPHINLSYGFRRSRAIRHKAYLYTALLSYLDPFCISKTNEQ